MHRQNGRAKVEESVLLEHSLIYIKHTFLNAEYNHAASYGGDIGNLWGVSAVG